MWEVHKYEKGIGHYEAWHTEGANLYEYGNRIFVSMFYLNDVEEGGRTVFPFTGNGKAIALGESEGLVKTIFDSETGELLGAHMIGAEVTELIQGYSIAKTLETTEAEIMETVFPHPTLSEMMHESALNAYGRTIHY